MVKHVVMWKLKDFAEGAAKRENALKIKSSLEALKSKIKEVKFLEVGISISEAADFYDIVLISEFKDLRDLEAYRKHPEHVKAAEFIGKVQLERKVVDYSA
jgi:Stress responsive A/B Barrel Domain